MRRLARREELGFFVDVGRTWPDFGFVALHKIWTMSAEFSPVLTLLVFVERFRQKIPHEFTPNCEFAGLPPLEIGPPDLANTHQ